MNYITNIHFGWMDFKIPVKKEQIIYLMKVYLLACHI